jgi:hypothetical protein
LAPVTPSKIASAPTPGITPPLQFPVVDQLLSAPPPVQIGMLQIYIFNQFFCHLNGCKPVLLNYSLLLYLIKATSVSTSSPRSSFFITVYVMVMI